MLYLIRSFGRGGKSYVKIGFTDSLSTRMNQYKIHNPRFEFIASRYGSKRDELILHLYLYHLGYKAEFLNEWFKDDPVIYQIFHKKIDKKIRKVLWKNRKTLFKLEDIGENMVIMKELYEDLRKEFSEDKRVEEIDHAWKLKEARRNIRKLKDLMSIDDILEGL